MAVAHTLPRYPHCTYSLPHPSGKWDGNGDPPALTSCSSSKHLDYDAVKVRVLCHGSWVDLPGSPMDHPYEPYLTPYTCPPVP